MRATRRGGASTARSWPAGCSAGQGMTLLARNWRCALGEIDIVARDGDCSSSARSRPAARRSLRHPARGRHRRQGWRGCGGWRPPGCERRTARDAARGPDRRRGGARPAARGRAASSTCGGWPDGARPRPGGRPGRARGPPRRGRGRRRATGCPRSRSSGCPTPRSPSRATGCARRWATAGRPCPAPRSRSTCRRPRCPRRGSSFDLAIAAACSPPPALVAERLFADVVLPRRARPRRPGAAGARACCPPSSPRSRAGFARRSSCRAANAAEAAAGPGHRGHPACARCADLVALHRGGAAADDRPAPWRPRPSPAPRRAARALRRPTSPTSSASSDAPPRARGRRRRRPPPAAARAAGRRQDDAGRAAARPAARPRRGAALEVTAVHSVAGALAAGAGAGQAPAVRGSAPHGVRGGARRRRDRPRRARAPRPCAHRGVLFLDEAPEFTLRRARRAAPAAGVRGAGHPPGARRRALPGPLPARARRQSVPLRPRHRRRVRTARAPRWPGGATCSGCRVRCSTGSTCRWRFLPVTRADLALDLPRRVDGRRRCAGGRRPRHCQANGCVRSGVAAATPRCSGQLLRGELALPRPVVADIDRALERGPPHGARLRPRAARRVDRWPISRG